MLASRGPCLEFFLPKSGCIDGKGCMQGKFSLHRGRSRGLGTGAHTAISGQRGLLETLRRVSTDIRPRYRMILGLFASCSNANGESRVQEREELTRPGARKSSSRKGKNSQRSDKINISRELLILVLDFFLKSVHHRRHRWVDTQV